MRKSSFLLPQLFLGAAMVWAQTAGIQGVVTDPAGRVIHGAHVQCGPAVASTGLDGRFDVAQATACLATVSAVGFQAQTLELSAGREARITLQVSGVTERIVVSAALHETTLEEAGVAASVITAPEIAARQYPPVADILRETPGLQIVTSGRQGSLSSVFTRGAERTGTLLLLDGVPISDPGGEANLGHLVSGDLDRIEVIRGPQSVLFGAEAAAGVIQMFTRRSQSENVRPRGSFSYERGNFGSDQWQANLNGGSGYRLAYSLHSSQYHTAGEYTNDDYRSTLGSANIGLRLSQATELRGVFRSGDSVVGVPGQVGFGLIDPNARQTNRDSALSLRLRDARSPNYLQQAFFNYHRVRDLYTDTVTDGPYELAALVRDVASPLPRTYLVSLLNPASIPATLPVGTRLVDQSITLYSLWEPYLSATSRKEFGYQGTWSKREITAVFGYNYERQEGTVSGNQVSRDNNGFFAHAERTLSARVFLSGGVRLEHSSAYGRKIAPRAAAGFMLAHDRGALSSLFLRFSAGRGITEPSLVQTYSRESYAVGNPNLRPEKTTSYEISLMQEWFGRRLRAEASAFQSSFRDLIAFVSLPAPVWGSWRNLQSSRARGMEFSARAKLTGQLTLNASYMRLWTRVLESTSPESLFYGIGQELPRRPGNSGALSLSFSPKRWWLQAGAALVGERQDADYYTGISRNPGYQNVYLCGSYRLTAHLIPYARVENLLNSNYQEALGYTAASRTFRGGVRLEW
jgi:outer membrane cobalamin receptor